MALGHTEWIPGGRSRRPLAAVADVWSYDSHMPDKARHGERMASAAQHCCRRRMIAPARCWSAPATRNVPGTVRCVSRRRLLPDDGDSLGFPGNTSGLPPRACSLLSTAPARRHHRPDTRGCRAWPPSAGSLSSSPLKNCCDGPSAPLRGACSLAYLFAMSRPQCPVRRAAGDPRDVFQQTAIGFAKAGRRGGARGAASAARPADRRTKEHCTPNLMVAAVLQPATTA